MQNITMTREGNTLTLRIDLAADLGPSKSGKTTMIATTNGNATIPGSDVKIGINAFRSAR